MSTLYWRQTHIGNMAAFRREIQNIVNTELSEEDEDENNLFNQEHAVLSSEAEETPCNEHYNDPMNGNLADIDDEIGGLVVTQQKQKVSANHEQGRGKRKAIWPESCINELVDVICESK